MSPEGSALRHRIARTKAAARSVASASRATKDGVLRAVASALDDVAAAPESALFVENEKDVSAARAAGMTEALVDRLLLNPKRVRAVASAVRAIADEDDPVGEITGMRRRPNGILVGQARIPLGVVAMIYESRPNVTIEAFALALKSGNAVVLRGGKEARRSNEALIAIARSALAAGGLPVEAAELVTGDPEGAASREEIRELVSLTGLVDLVIPRGGEALIRFVTEHARVPVIQHYRGVCHVYVDASADLEAADRIVEDAKLSRVGVCNALECLLVDEAVADAFLPRLRRLAEKGLEIRGDARTAALLPEAKRATDADYGFEFLAPILAVRVVAGIDGAIDHIARFGSQHTESIVTGDYARAQRFLREVDASCVLVNASTRFNDGGELGLGAEMGISTSKLHAYGPMGLVHLTSLKWIVYGEGQVRGT